MGSVRKLRLGLGSLLFIASVVAVSVIAPPADEASAAPTMGFGARCGSSETYGTVRGEWGSNSNATFVCAFIDQVSGFGNWNRPSGVSTYKIWWVGGGGGGASVWHTRVSDSVCARSGSPAYFQNTTQSAASLSWYVGRGGSGGDTPTRPTGFNQTYTTPGNSGEASWINYAGFQHSNPGGAGASSGFYLNMPCQLGSNDTGSWGEYGGRSSGEAIGPYDSPGYGAQGGTGAVIVTFAPAVPSAPSAVSAVAASGPAASVSWTAPATNLDWVTYYTVTATSSNGGTTRTCDSRRAASAMTAPVTSCTVSSLTAGKTYTFTVKAYNALDSGSSASAASAAFVVGESQVTQQPAGRVGAALATQPAVTLTTRSPVQGIVVTASLGTSPTPSGLQTAAVLSGTLTATTDSAGVATFSNLAISGPIGTYTLIFTAPGFGTATSSSFTLALGTASALKVSTQPSSGGTSGGVIPGSPAVTVTDAGGNAVTSQPATTVTVSSTTGTIGGTTTATTSSGVATFSAATLAGLIAPTTHTLTFAAAGFTSVTSSTFTLATRGSGAMLSILTQPVANVAVGTNFTTQPAVGVVDAGGNVVTSHPATVVTASRASGSSSGSLPVTTATTSSGVATYSGFKMNGAGGDYTVTFSAPGLGSVTSATFSVNRTAQSITFGSLSAKTFGDPAFRITATASSGLVVAFSSTTTPGVCSVAGDTTITGGSATAAVVTLLGAGTCTIAANQAGNDTFAAAAQQTQTFTVNPAAQATLTLTNPSTLNYGSGLNLATSGGSGTGAVSYALIGGAGSAQCVLNGTTGAMTFGSVGTCTVQATKAADTNYTVKQSAQQILTVARAPQSTSFTSAIPTNPLPGGTYAVTTTASSGLTPALAILAGSGTVCSLAGSTVSFLASGTCTLIAAQAGSANYLPANPEAQQSIVVGSLNQNITFTQPTNMNFGDPNKLLAASSSSGLAVTLTSQTTSVCTLSGAVVAIVAVGQCEIKATQAGNSRYAAASDVYRTFDVVAVVATAPTIRSASVSSGAFTVGFTAPGFDGGASIVGYRLVATPTGAGTTVTDDSCVTSPCTINGLTNGTEYTVTVAAINSAGVGGASTASPAMTPVTNALAVQSLLSTPGDGQLAISWTAPADFGGGAFVQYEVRLRESGSSWPVSATQTVSSSASGSVTLTGLDNGTEYEVQVITITAANTSSYEGNTAVVAAIPRRVPSVPRSLLATETAATSVLISWAVPISDGGASITSYSVSMSGGASCGVVTINVMTKAGSCMASGLAYSTTYSISVVAINVAGSSIAATTTHTTQAAPASTGGTGSDDSSTSTTTTVPSGVSSTTVPTRSRTTATLPRSTATQTTVPGEENEDENATTDTDEESSTGGKSPTIGALAPLLARSGPMVVMSVEGKLSTPETSFTAEGVSIVGGGVNIDMVALGGTKLSDTTTGRVMICGTGAMSFSFVGLQPQSMVVVWLRPDSTRLVDDMTTTDGSIELDVRLPSDLATGDHEMQIDMVNERGEESAMAAGFRFEPICGKRNNPINAGTLLVGISVLALGFLLVAGFRRRSRESSR